MQSPAQGTMQRTLRRSQVQEPAGEAPNQHPLRFMASKQGTVKPVQNLAGAKTLIYLYMYIIKISLVHMLCFPVS